MTEPTSTTHHTRSEPSNAEDPLGQDRPHSARICDYYLGGKTNYLVDRDVAQAVARVLPAIETVARANRSYMQRAVRYMAEQGVRQFIDLGTGLPASPNLHEVAQAVTPDSRVIYVDNDPIVLAYADELLDTTSEDRTRCVQADVTRPDEVLAAVAAEHTLDFDRPVALTLHCVLHLVPDAEQPHSLIGRLLDRLAPGSFLSLSHCTGDLAPKAWQTVIDVCAQHGICAQVRTLAEVRQLFDGLQLVEPGVVLAHHWRPDAGSSPNPLGDRHISLYAGMARKT